jgi:hypothetical protein
MAAAATRGWVLLIPTDYLGGAFKGGFTTIWLLDPPRAVADTPGRLVLLPIGDRTTRLLVRESASANTPGGGIIGSAAGRLLWDPLHFVMVQRMLRGVKERAEGQPLVPSGS